MVIRTYFFTKLPVIYIHVQVYCYLQYCFVLFYVGDISIFCSNITFAWIRHGGANFQKKKKNV